MKKLLICILTLSLTTLLLSSCGGLISGLLGGTQSGDGSNSGTDTGDNTTDGDDVGDNTTDGEECTHSDEVKDGLCDKCGDTLDNGESSDENNKIPDGTIYNESNTAVLIYNSSDPSATVDAVKGVQTYIRDNFSRHFVVFHDKSVPYDHEIVFGDTTRDISSVAKEVLYAKLEAEKELLSATGIEEDDMAGYMVYSNGSSVAVVWTHFQLAEVAIAYFRDNYLDASTLALKNGYSSSKFLSLDAYLTLREEKIMEEKWAALEAAIPEEYREDIITEMRKYYSLFDTKDDLLVDWLASLYDVETGAWYGTVSAKTTPGFLPDIEHTYQALHLLRDTGMAEMFDGDWSKALPRDMLEKIAYWIYDMQDPDGYFYHPQWPKKFIEANGYQLRITRDKGSATTVLKAIGITPKYSGYLSSEESLPGTLGESTVAAVSKVVYSSALLEEYSSTENFREYLDEFEESLKSMSDSERSQAFYSFSSHFQTTVTLMNSEMKKMTSDFFDKHQNPKNGMWSEDLYYSSTNAMHKIVSVYNQLGAEVKYAEKIVDSTLEILKWDVHTKPTSTVYDLYNVWTVFPYLYQNIRKYAEGSIVERYARCEAIKNLVYEGVADAMHVSYEQMIDYSHPDGSGSIYRFYSLGSATAFCPTAVPLTKEGSIAGFITVNYAMPYYMLAALELEDYIIPIFTEQDRVSYVKKLMNAEPNVKGTLLLTEAKIYDFEDTPIDSVPEEITVSIGSNKVPNENTYLKVGDDGTGNRVLMFNATARVVENGRNYNATLKANHTEDDPNVAQFEFDYKLNSEKTNKHITEMLFYAGNTSTPVFQITIGLDASGSLYATAGDGSLIGNVGVMDEYVHITIEYEWEAREYRVYSDGALVGVCGYTYGGTANHEMIGSVNISSVSTTEANYYLDNICFKTYKK